MATQTYLGLSVGVFFFHVKSLQSCAGAQISLLVNRQTSTRTLENLPTSNRQTGKLKTEGYKLDTVKLKTEKLANSQLGSFRLLEFRGSFQIMVILSAAVHSSFAYILCQLFLYIFCHTTKRIVTRRTNQMLSFVIEQFALSIFLAYHNYYIFTFN